MTNNELIESLAEDLRMTYGCHTAILYGSRARDDWEATSDIDVIAFRDTGEHQRVASRWNGVFLDLFVHSTNDEADPGWTRINGGRILFQRDGFGDKVLDDVKAMFDAGPEDVPSAELQVVRRETGKEERVKVPDYEDLANHVVPESCAMCREAHGEALTGVRIGQPLSHDRTLIPGADVVTSAEGNTTERATASAPLARRGLRPWHARTLLTREPGDLSSGQRQYGLVRVGKARSRSR